MTENGPEGQPLHYPPHLTCNCLHQMSGFRKGLVGAFQQQVIAVCQSIVGIPGTAKESRPTNRAGRAERSWARRHQAACSATLQGARPLKKEKRPSGPSSRGSAACGWAMGVAGVKIGCRPVVGGHSKLEQKHRPGAKPDYTSCPLNLYTAQMHIYASLLGRGVSFQCRGAQRQNEHATYPGTL